MSRLSFSYCFTLQQSTSEFMIYTSAPIFHRKLHHFGEEYFCALAKLSEQFLKYLKSY